MATERVPAAASNEDEFAAFVAAGSRRLLQIARLVTGDPQRAEDLTQTALANAYRRWPAVRDGDPFAYVRRSIVNGHISWWRRQRTQPERLVDELPDWVSVADAVNDIARRDLLRRAMAMLTRRERAVIALRYFEDLSEQAVADELGIALGTVKSTHARALAKLRVNPHVRHEPLSGKEQR